ncbi:MAG: phage holin family protein [Actinomycetota bacterium]
MADGSGTSGTVGEIKELVELVRTYAKQETVDPLKRAGRYLGFGIAGALVLALGLVFLGMALLRVLQDEAGSWTTGSLSWLPYAITVVALTITVAILMVVATRSGEGST